MSEVILHDYKIPAKGVRKKIIYHFSDLHLTEYDGLSDEAEIERAKNSVTEWEKIRREFAENHGEPYGEEQKQNGKTHFSNLINSAADADALVLAGDIIDYPSGANMRLVEEKLGSLGSPVFFVCGNHDSWGDVPEGFIYSSVTDSFKKLVLDDIVFIGINNSQRVISAEQNAFLEKELENNKNVIIVMHIPIMGDGNKEEFSKIGDNFKINHPGAPRENFRFVEIIKENAEKIIAVMAGHTHFSSMGEIASGIPQFVSSQGITGHLNRYEIGE